MEVRAVAELFVSLLIHQNHLSDHFRKSLCEGETPKNWQVLSSINSSHSKNLANAKTRAAARHFAQTIQVKLTTSIWPTSTQPIKVLRIVQCFSTHTTLAEKFFLLPRADCPTSHPMKLNLRRSNTLQLQHNLYVVDTARHVQHAIMGAKSSAINKNWLPSLPIIIVTKGNHGSLMFSMSNITLLPQESCLAFNVVDNMHVIIGALSKSPDPPPPPWQRHMQFPRGLLIHGVFSTPFSFLIAQHRWNHTKTACNNISFFPLAQCTHETLPQLAPLICNPIRQIQTTTLIVSRKVQNPIYRLALGFARVCARCNSCNLDPAAIWWRASSITTSGNHFKAAFCLKFSKKALNNHLTTHVVRGADANMVPRSVPHDSILITQTTPLPLSTRILSSKPSTRPNRDFKKFVLVNTPAQLSANHDRKNCWILRACTVNANMQPGSPHRSLNHKLAPEKHSLPHILYSLLDRTLQATRLPRECVSLKLLSMELKPCSRCKANMGSGCTTQYSPSMERLPQKHCCHTATYTTRSATRSWIAGNCATAACSKRRCCHVRSTMMATPDTAWQCRLRVFTADRHAAHASTAGLFLQRRTHRCSCSHWLRPRRAFSASAMNALSSARRNHRRAAFCITPAALRRVATTPCHVHRRLCSSAICITQLCRRSRNIQPDNSHRSAPSAAALACHASNARNTVRIWNLMQPSVRANRRRAFPQAVNRIRTQVSAMTVLSATDYTLSLSGQQISKTTYHKQAASGHVVQNDISKNRCYGSLYNKATKPYIAPHTLHKQRATHLQWQSQIVRDHGHTAVKNASTLFAAFPLLSDAGTTILLNTTSRLVQAISYITQCILLNVCSNRPKLQTKITKLAKPHLLLKAIVLETFQSLKAHLKSLVRLANNSHRLKKTDLEHLHRQITCKHTTWLKNVKRCSLHTGKLKNFNKTNFHQNLLTLSTHCTSDSFVSLHWQAVHTNILKPRSHLSQSTSLHKQNRLACRGHLSHLVQDCEWLALHLPTLAMVISKAQNCTVNIQTHGNQRHSADVAWTKLPSTSSHTPVQMDILPHFGHKTIVTTRNNAAPYHLFKQFLINYIKMVCLVDTGATSSLTVRKSALTQIQQAQLNSTGTLEPAPWHLVLGTSGHRIESFGMRTNVTARQERGVTLPSAKKTTRSITAAQTLDSPKPTIPYQFGLPDTTHSIPSGTHAVVSGFCPIPDPPPFEKGKLFFFDPEESLMAHKGICILPAGQASQDCSGTLDTHLLVANFPSKTDVKLNPGQKPPRAALVTRMGSAMAKSATLLAITKGTVVSCHTVMKSIGFIIGHYNSLAISCCNGCALRLHCQMDRKFNSPSKLPRHKLCNTSDLLTPLACQIPSRPYDHQVSPQRVTPSAKEGGV